MAEIRWKDVSLVSLGDDSSVTDLDTATTSETTDSRLGDTLDVVSKDLAMTLSSALFDSSQRGDF